MRRPLAIVQRPVQNSLCFGVYRDTEPVGFAGVVTDYATFSWLCDVFNLAAYQGCGLGKWLIATIVEYPELQSVSQFLLATRDAHELYRRYGDFKALSVPHKWMIRAGQASHRDRLSVEMTPGKRFPPETQRGHSWVCKGNPMNLYSALPPILDEDFGEPQEQTVKYQCSSLEF